MESPEDPIAPLPPAAPQEGYRARIVTLGVLFEGGAGLLALLLGWLFGMDLRGKLHFTSYDLGVGLAATFPLLVMLLVTTYYPVGPFKTVQQFLDEFLLPLLKDCTLADLALISVLAGIGEELLFRGVLQDGLVDWLGLAAGVGLASLLFGLAHRVNTAYFELTAVMGIYLGAVRIACDSLSGVMLAHGLYDFIALVFLLRIRRCSPPSNAA